MNTKKIAPSSEDILIVDDTEANLKLLTTILGVAGYRARAARDGEIALRSVEVKPPALILLDIRMPGMDGFEVCHRLKANASTRDIPVIFLSAVAETADKVTGFELGAVDYIAKPFEPLEVLARISTQLALAAAQRELKTQNRKLNEANEQLNAEIAERKRAEEALRESRDRLDDIYRSVGDGIISADADQRIVLFNAAAERIFGYPAAAVIGKPLTVLLPKRFRATHPQKVRDFGVSGEAFHNMGTFRQLYGLRANGEEFPLEATVSQSRVASDKIFTAILRDITARKQAEQIREQFLEKLQQLSEDLAIAQEEERSNITYELHEQLGQELIALKAHLQLVKLAGGSEANTACDDAMAVAVQATERIRRLVLDLYPRELDDLGLHAAVRSYCQQQATAGGWRLNLDAPTPARRASRRIERACFRVFQEGLASILHHALASEISVQLRHGAERLELVIRGNGVKRERGDESLDLFGMQIRAKQAGGVVEMRPIPGSGIEIRAIFPRS